MSLRSGCGALLCVAAVGAFAAQDASAVATSWVVHEYRVSAPVPLRSGCRDAGVANTPQIAVNPSNVNDEAVTYGVGDGSASVLARSRDSGHSWTRTPITGTVACDGGSSAYADRFDPDLAFSPGGQLYLSESVQSGGKQSGTSGVNVLVAGPGGVPTAIGSPNPLTGLQRGFLAFPGPSSDVDVLTEQIGYVAGQYEPFGASLAISRSQDSGRSWAPQTIYSAPADQSVVAQGLHAQGDRVEAFADSIDATALPGDLGLASEYEEHAIALRSDDGGTTWSAPQTIFSHEVGSDAVTACCLFRPAFGSDGAIYWADASQGQLSVWSSSDGGVHWAQHAVASLGGVSEPTVAVDPDGTVAVSYYQLSGSGNAMTAAPRIAISRDHAQSWQILNLGSPFTVNALGSVDDTSPLGPVQGLAAIPTGFRAAMTVPGGQADNAGHVDQISVTRHRQKARTPPRP